ncbi:hypothetical protein Tco_1432495, partial [Tanacetum coccineum]
MSDEEELRTTCFVAVSKDPNDRRDEKMECFGGKFLGSYNSSTPFERTKDYVEVGDVECNVKGLMLYTNVSMVHDKGETIGGNAELFGEDKRQRHPEARAAKKTKFESTS